MPTIGIVGGGQLGRMLTLAALPLGFRVIVVDPSEHSPAAQVGADAIRADLYDRDALRKLAELSDFITVEIEHLDADALEKLLDTKTPINPAPKTIKLIQDKLRQKEFLHANKISVAPFEQVNSVTDAKKLLKSFGGTMIIKTRHGAYDGRGNMVVKNNKDIEKAFELFDGRELYAEKIIPFKKELAVMVARSLNGEIRAYPVVETIHERNICLEVHAPADVTKAQYKRAQDIAKKAVAKLDGAGMFGVELFLTKTDKVLVNEIAPRVHNSGHYTMDAARVSQFEQHIRAISGLPLGSTELVTPAAVMINILGERNGPVELRGVDKALSLPHTSIHVYGKSPTKIDRKMGHLTATGASVSQARKRAKAARKVIHI